MVNKIKQNEKFRSDYAAMNLHDRDITRRAKNEGRQEKAVEAAVNFLKKNIPAETIAECVGLTLEQVKELAEKITVQA